MSTITPERRMRENEAVFRGFNEKMQQGLDDLMQMAKEDGQESMVSLDDRPLYFYCECSDENCKKRVLIKPSIYKIIHQTRNMFTVVSGHEVDSIEKVTNRTEEYFVVEKFVTPKNPKKLQKTDVDNV